MSRFLILPAAMVLAGWCGYRQGLSSSAPAAEARITRPVSARSQPEAPVNSPARADRGFISRSLPRWGDDVERWQTISGYSEIRIKAALETVHRNRHSGGGQQLSSMLYYRWGQLNPRAAIASEELHGYNTLRSVYPAGDPDRFSPATLAWMKQEPGIAETAAKEIQQKIRLRAAADLSAPLPAVLHPRQPAPPPPPPPYDPALDPFAPSAQ